MSEAAWQAVFGAAFAMLGGIMFKLRRFLVRTNWKGEPKPDDALMRVLRVGLPLTAVATGVGVLIAGLVRLAWH